MSNNDTFYIESDTELKEFCDQLRKGAWIGVDTEFMRERTYYSEPCLVQLSGDAGIACVDVLAIENLDPLKEVLCREEIVKLMHSCSQDLEIFHLLFDAIHYAEDDVRYLPALYESLSAELEKTGHRAWFDEEMQGISNTDVHGINEQNAWQRMNALKQMAGQPLAAAKALAGWRESRAQARNKPKSWILADRVLVQIAYALPETLNELEAIEDVPEGFVKHQGNRVLSIIRQSAEHNESEQPSGPGRPDAREKALKKELAGILDTAAEKINIPASILATRRDLTALIQGDRDLPILQGWRAEIVGNDLLAYLQSREE